MTNQTPSSPHFNELDASRANLFDVTAARDAQPVVPLESSPHAKPAARRSWLLGAIAVSALVGSLTGIGAFSLYQRRNTNRTAASQVTASPVTSATATPQTLASPVLESSATVTSTPPTPNGNDELHAGATSAVSAREDKPAANANRVVTVANDSEADARERRTVKEPVATAGARATNDNSARARAKDLSAAREREARNTSHNEESNARANRSAERERRVTAAPRTEQPSDDESEHAPTTRPGYVDAVRRAIGDRPGRGRRQQQRRRAREANADRVREIFEGQEPQR